MLICGECGSLFERARTIVERHGLDTPPYEELLVCPCCGETSIFPACRCDLCNAAFISIHRNRYLKLFFHRLNDRNHPACLLLIGNLCISRPCGFPADIDHICTISYHLFRML